VWWSSGTRWWCDEADARRGLRCRRGHCPLPDPAQPVIARLWRDKRLRREAGGVRGLCAQTVVAGYLRTPAAGAAYILTANSTTGWANCSPSASETTTTTSAGSPATTSTKWCSTRRPRLPHRKPHPHQLQVTDPTDNTTGAVSQRDPHCSRSHAQGTYRTTTKRRRSCG
jgi:hypothetical protein